MQFVKQFGLFGFKNILYINLLKCCHKNSATYPGKTLHVSLLLITCMPSADLTNSFLSICQMSYVRRITALDFSLQFLLFMFLEARRLANYQSAFQSPNIPYSVSLPNWGKRLWKAVTDKKNQVFPLTKQLLPILFKAVFILCFSSFMPHADWNQTGRKGPDHLPYS